MKNLMLAKCMYMNKCAILLVEARYIKHHNVGTKLTHCGIILERKIIIERNIICTFKDSKNI